MKKVLTIIFRLLLVIVITIWIGLIIVEYNRFQHNEPLLAAIKEEVLDYDDGHVYVYYGMGYKAISYERTSIYGKEFGHIFTKVRDGLSNGG